MNSSKKLALVLIRGLPGSGKSYLVDRMNKYLLDKDYVVLDPDRVDQNSEEFIQLKTELLEQGVDDKFHVYRYLRAKAHSAIDNDKIIFWTQAFTNLDGFQKTINNLTQYAKDQNKKLPLLVVEIEIDPKTAQDRIELRTRNGGLDVNIDRFTSFVADYSSFSDQGYNILKLSGNNDIGLSADKLIEAIQAL